MRRPVIETAIGKVVNVVELIEGSEWQPPAGHELGAEGGAIGDTWDGTAYVKPPDPPESTPTSTELAAQIDAVEGRTDMVALYLRALVYALAEKFGNTPAQVHNRLKAIIEENNAWR